MYNKLSIWLSRIAADLGMDPFGSSRKTAKKILRKALFDLADFIDGISEKYHHA